MKNLISFLNDRFFSSSYQIQRIVIYLGIAFVLGAISFGSYYYYDRYHTDQPKVVELTIAEAEQAVRDDPQSAHNRLALAQAYMLNARWDDALTQGNQVLTAEPENQIAWMVVGVSNANSGRPADAIEPLTKFVDARKDEEMAALDKQLISAAYYLGDSYLQLGKPQDAIPPLEMAVNWSQTDADAMYKLGLAYSAVQQYENATFMFMTATTLVPDYVEAYQALANTYDALNEPDLALYARGMMAYAQKDYTKARDMLLKSAIGKPDFAPTFAGLGRINEALNDLPNAKSSYETALKLDPDNFTASNGIQRVDALLKK
jgi:tetratricopeptide (TPR) repeat protein